MRLLKTFIVEDSQIIRDGLIAALEELGPVQVVGHAENESAALQWLGRAEHTVDLVIVDLFLRSGSGLGVLAAFKRLQRHGQVVVLSNYATAAMRTRCLALGADQVFDKSHDIEALLDYCKGLVREAGAPPGADRPGMPS